MHTTRKQFKRMRGLYRLVQSADKEFREKENTRIGEAMRALAAVRDATSRIECARHLAVSASTADEHMAIIRICDRLVEWRKEHAPSGEEMAALQARTIATCHEAKALDTFSAPDSARATSRTFGRGWMRTSDRAAKAIENARNGGDAESFHALRKRAQDRWMQSGFLAEAWPSAFFASSARSKRLVQLLGVNQDIALLGNFIDTHAADLGSFGDVAHLLSVMIAESTRMRAEALPLADAIFAGRPEREGERVELLWRYACKVRR
ncbi:CHAD domain-containing protein [Sinorhizobium sp. BG8]|nr:CHAD domain-containing protein [Sinorhizobium sp. BG8]